MNAHACGVFLLDRKPSDPTIGNPTEPTDKTVNLTDREGNAYVGTLVLAANTWTEATQYVAIGYKTGQVIGRGVDGYQTHDVPCHGLVILDLAKRPRAGHPLSFTTD